MEHRARSLIAAASVFVALLFPLRLPEYFWYISISVSLLSSLSVFWVFDEKPNLERLKEYWFTILFLFIFVISLGTFSYTLAHPAFQALMLGTTGFFVYQILQVASRLKRGYKPNLFLRNIISLSSILGVFFSVSNALKFSSSTDIRWYQILSIITIFVSVFVISEFLFEVQGFENSILYSLILSFAISQISWLSSFWLISYPYNEKATNIGVPLPSILSAVYFYLFWGISHHRLEGSLTRKILWEYLLIATFFTLIIIVTAQWLPNS